MANHLKISLIFSYLSIFVNILSGILFTPWFISFLGDSEYSIYIIITSLSSYFMIDFGFNHALSKKICELKFNNNQLYIEQAINVVLNKFVKASFFIGIMMIIGYLSLPYIFYNFNSVHLELLKKSFLIVGIYSFFSFPFLAIDAIFIAFEKFVFLKTIEIFNKIIFIVTAIFLLTNAFGVLSILTLNGILLIAILFVKLLYIRKFLKLKFNFLYSNKIIFKEMLHVSFWTTITSLANRFFFNITPTVLGMFSNAFQITCFSIGNVIEGYIWIFAQALNGLFLNKLTNIHNDNESKEKVILFVSRIGRLQILIISYILISFISFGQDFINLWIGQKYSNAYFVVCVLILPSLIILSQETLNTYLIVINKLKFKALITIYSAITSVLLSLLLVEQFGAIGSALAITVSVFVFQIGIMNWYYWKRIDLNMVYFYKECFLKFLIPILIILIVGFLINQIGLQLNWITFILKNSILLIAYVLIFWYFALNETEKQMFKSIFKKHATN